jgi:hypothetical protein
VLCRMACGVFGIHHNRSSSTFRATSRIGPLLLDRFTGRYYSLDSRTASLVKVLSDLSYHDHPRRSRYLRFVLSASSTVEVVVYRFNALLQIKVDPVIKGVLAGGGNNVPLGSRGLAGERYAVVTVGGGEKHIVSLRRHALPFEVCVQARSL